MQPSEVVIDKANGQVVGSREWHQALGAEGIARFLRIVLEKREGEGAQLQYCANCGEVLYAPFGGTFDVLAQGLCRLCAYDVVKALARRGGSNFEQALAVLDLYSDTVNLP